MQYLLLLLFIVATASAQIVTCERLAPLLLAEGYNVTFAQPSVFHTQKAGTVQYCALDVRQIKTGRFSQVFLPEQLLWNKNAWHILLEPDMQNHMEVHCCFNQTSQRKQLRQPLPTDLETVAYFVSLGNAVLVEKRPPLPEQPHALFAVLMHRLVVHYYRSEDFTALGQNNLLYC
jgi:hypothetical protein